MSDDSIFKKFSNWFHNNFVMPKEFKRKIIDDNYKRLLVIDWILFIFGVTFSILCITGTYLTISYKTTLIYFLSYAVSSLISIILIYSFRNKDNLPLFIRNLPVTFSFIVLLIIIIYLFYAGESQFKTFIIYSCISIIVPILFNIEPLLYGSITSLAAIAMVICIDPLSNIAIVIDILIFVILMDILSMFKWNSTIQEMKYQKEQSEHTKRLEKEINLAAFVQKSFYNHIDVKFEGWNIEYYSEAMAGVSGDMYDIYFHDKTLDGIGVFDVSGHGISSGLVTMLVKNIIQQEFSQGINKQIQTVMKSINDRIIKEKGDIENFLTGILARFNDNTIEFINAGNPQPIIFDSKNENAYFYENSSSNHYGVIGMADFPVNYSVNTIEMKSGDSILFYTDGIIENCNSQNFPYGKNNLMQSFKTNTYKTSKDQLEDIVNSYKEFKGSEKSSDDITLLLLKKL